MKKPLQPSLTFASKVNNLDLRGAPRKYSTWESSVYFFTVFNLQKMIKICKPHLIFIHSKLNFSWQHWVIKRQWKFCCGISKFQTILLKIIQRMKKPVQLSLTFLIKVISLVLRGAPRKHSNWECSVYNLL